MTIPTLLFWIAATCCVVAELAILRSLLFGRAATASRSGDVSGTARTPNRVSEIAWAILPAVGLLFVLYLTWRTIDAPPAPPAPPVEASRGAIIGA